MGDVTRTATRAPKVDQACAEAVEIARAAITEDPGHVGEHLNVTAEGDRVVTHYFSCDLPGYRGWQWAVTVTRAPRSKHVTVCETVLLPGGDALLAPGWVPWHERLHPGDLGVGDLLPTPEDDDRLTPGYMLGGDPEVDDVAWELGLGRPRILSPLGREEAAQRWYDGESGPDAPISVAAPRTARCVSCAFYVRLGGTLGRMFGACTNVYAPDDGRVVSLDHGCGGHSEVLIDETVIPAPPTIYDDGGVEEVEV
ncbi:DUF3027 domain-containing protein [Catellatospora bangladeshensis]|uniref:DUF3027 domain-containing protein n=1 Tax=Catellatospora bangladeshensis TaxID=310355 RepID=A0A8J3JSR7_9ACTN|nr:DUF3027 domain-containing protein [Catellatospora bangladeshensis]GIF82494.1 hypothetical protein Cba03nite_38430 [Catellatospora bangladeshensis]